VNLPLAQHGYGEHRPVLPPQDQARHDDAPIPLEVRLRLYRSLQEMRQFEKRAYDLFMRQLVKGTSHLSLGMEAIAAGFGAALRPDDYTFATYRGHAHTLARGVPMTPVLAELLGRANGLMGGKGGSMHLTSVEHGMMGSYAIIGAHLTIANGAAWSAQYRGTEQVAVCFFGDGTTNIGAFHEALNLAAIWDLPIVFQVINNLYGMGTGVAQASGEPEQWKRAAAYRLHGERVDGNDVLAVREAATRLLDIARRDRRPALLETMSYRIRGHSVADAGKVYRTPDEIDEWRTRDPIERFVTVAKEQGLLDDDEVAEVRQEVEAEVADAIKQAAAADAPDPSQLYSHVYGDPRRSEQFSRMDPGAAYGERKGTASWRR
jgi:pyruvate dehydrogenase E1 component alpha subunit